MEEVILTDSELDQEARLNVVRDLLHKGRCLVEFTKVDGTGRTMMCTLNEALMDVANRVISDDVADVPKNSNVITVWSLENTSWRAMRVMNIKTVKLLPDSWTITVEEDPETGELLLPLPEDLLKIQGWNTGDTFEWEDNEDGSWSLRKV